VLQQWLLTERNGCSERALKGVERDEYMRLVGRVASIDATLEQMEELYRKYIQDDEDEDDE
jgi:hypothetical protein